MTAPLRIAVADDDPDTRASLGRPLPRPGHAASSAAATGRELVEHCRRSPPDLVVADARMPDPGGLEAPEAVARVAPAPAVLLTGHPDPGAVERARDLGVMAYLVRPVTEGDPGPATARAGRHLEEVQARRRESAGPRRAPEDRTAVERAGGAACRRRGLPEAEAYRRVRRAATDGGRELVEVARQLPAAEDAFRALEDPG